MATFAKYLLGVWVAACVAGTFLWLREVPTFPDPQLARIVALHLPNAMVVMVASIMAGAFGWRYLTRGRRPLDDARSKTAAVLAVLFCLLTTVTGSVFAKVQWGAYWNWDPKQICIFILLLIYAAYFVLRGGIEDPDRRGTIAAVYVLFAAVMTPLLGYVVPKYLPSLHPANTRFDAQYHLVIWSMTAGLLGLYSWLFNLAVRQERAQLALDELAFEGDF
ncbi:MAG: cytochrome c biogenesis protein CcsA [Cytophagales bacterium]|nr:cytochrome c biogenesis protein CcsA [Armatimonadota bacterium]